MNPTSRDASSPSYPELPTHLAARGILLARPSPPRPARAQQPGRLALGLGGKRDGFVHVPRGVNAAEPTPLVVFFHGAGGDAGQAEIVRPFADERRVLVLSIDSRATTWDVIDDEIGPDVVFLDRALRWTFARFHVDPARVAVSGFSDGASYALSLGLANGELFRRVIAFSPGFSAAPEVHGKPLVFVSHGIKDAVLPVDPCSRRIVKRLQGSGYAVTYREFDGPHAVPPDIAQGAFAWFLD
jgi:phospholipase/carboxylesterase